MKKITLEQIIALHTLLAEKQQGHGLEGIRDRGVLESALESPFQSFGEQELYPTLLEKAARLAFGLIKNHPFLDGNKRIGILGMLVFLKINEVPLSFSNEELIDYGIGIAASKYSYEDIVEWLRKK